jgi:hypothetical protein
MTKSDGVQQSNNQRTNGGAAAAAAAAVVAAQQREVGGSLAAAAQWRQRGGGSAKAQRRWQLGGGEAVAAARQRDVRVPPSLSCRSSGNDHRGRQQGQRRDGSSDNRDVEGADRNNNNQPLERAEGEAVAIKKIMGGVAGILMTMPWTSSSLIRRGRMGGGGGGR